MRSSKEGFEQSADKAWGSRRPHLCACPFPHKDTSVTDGHPSASTAGPELSAQGRPTPPVRQGHRMNSSDSQQRHSPATTGPGERVPG